MTEQSTNNAVRHTMTVPVPAGRAFTIFTEGLATWWPQEYTWAQENLDTIGIETHEGGRCFECGPHGFWIDWGRVLAWEPPRRLVLSWQISPSREPVPDPAKASEIEVRFEEQETSGTQVKFEHRWFERHGEGSENYRAALGSDQGWKYILDRYVAAVN